MSCKNYRNSAKLEISSFIWEWKLSHYIRYDDFQEYLSVLSVPISSEDPRFCITVECPASHFILRFLASSDYVIEYCTFQVLFLFTPSLGGDKLYNPFQFFVLTGPFGYVFKPRRLFTLIPSIGTYDTITRWNVFPGNGTLLYWSIYSRNTPVPVHDQVCAPSQLSELDAIK